MIKSFESFKLIDPTSRNEVESEFEKAYKYVRLLHNDSYPTPEEFTHKYLNDKFFDIDWLVKDLSEVEGDITYEDKSNVIECYYRIYKEYKLEEFPDFEDIDTYFLSLYDLTEVSFVILLKDKTIKYEIKTLPSVKYYLKDDIEFDINEFDTITQEIIPTVKRLSETYKVKTLINKFSNIKVLISL